MSPKSKKQSSKDKKMLSKVKGKKSYKKSKKRPPSNILLSETFFKQTRRPKPQASASAQLTVKAALDPEEPEMTYEDFDKKNCDIENNNLVDDDVLEPEENNNIDDDLLLPEDDSYVDDDLLLPEDNNNVTPKSKRFISALLDHGSSDEETNDSQMDKNRSLSGSPNDEPSKPKDVKCNFCGKWFPNRYFQRKHRLMEHDNQLYECRVCSFNSVEPITLKRHILKMHVEKKEKSGGLNAESLQKEFDSLIARKMPRKVMMEDGVPLGRDATTAMRFVCALCNRVYTSKYSLARHVRCHTQEKPFQCDVCDFTSSYREHMTRHMTSAHLIVHSNEPQVKYSPRKKTGTPKPPKKRRNIQRLRYECAVCGVKNSHKSFLMDHIKEKHPNAHIESMDNADGSKVHLIVTVSKQPVPSKRLTIVCEYCSLIFHDSWKHKVHLRSHTGVKPFCCSECEFRATSKMTVRDHIHRRHPTALDTAKIKLRTVGIDGEVEEIDMALPWKEFKCEYCGEILKDNYSYKLHKSKEHKDELPFQCVACCYKDAAKAGMAIHCMEQHPDQEADSLILKHGKPLKLGKLRVPTCDQCNKSFPYRSQLNIHMKQHTGEKSITCEHCGYKSNNKSAIRKHIARVHCAESQEKEPPKKISRRKAVRPKKRKIKYEMSSDLSSDED